MVKVGEEFVRTEVQFIPAKLKVIDHYRETYECRSCRKNGTPYMEKAPVPYPPVLHSLASASTITWLIHQKFELSIPLYRQEKEWEALGLRLSRATMSNWLLVVYRDWLLHIVHHLKLELLKQRYLHIDETHVQVLKEPGRKKYVRFLYVGLLQHQRCRKSHPLLRVPAGTKREISGSVSEGI